MKLLKTQDYLLFIDEEVEIKGKPFLCYNSIKKTWDEDIVLYQGAMPEYHYAGLQKIIAYYPLTKEAKELDLPLLPNPFKTYRVGRKQKRAILDEKGVEIGVFKTGSEEQAQKYCDYLNNKQFSLEDVKKAIEMAREYEFIRFGDGDTENKYTEEEIIQSLSTQQLPKEFVPEYKYYYQSSKEFYSDAGFVECSKEQYESIKIEIPTCPLKAEIKTITNSKGREEIMGIYKY